MLVFKVNLFSYIAFTIYLLSELNEVNLLEITKRIKTLIKTRYL